MIEELVQIKLPEGTTAEGIIEEARRSLEHWQGYPRLIRKQYSRGDG